MDITSIFNWGKEFTVNYYWWGVLAAFFMGLMGALFSAKKISNIPVTSFISIIFMAFASWAWVFLAVVYMVFFASTLFIVMVVTLVMTWVIAKGVKMGLVEWNNITLKHMMDSKTYRNPLKNVSDTAIVVHPFICKGEPSIGKTKIAIWKIVSFMQMGEGTDGAADEFNITKEQAETAWGYFLGHRKEIRDAIIKYKGY